MCIEERRKELFPEAEFTECLGNLDGGYLGNEFEVFSDFGIAGFGKDGREMHINQTGVNLLKE